MDSGGLRMVAYRKLVAWRLADELAHGVYDVCLKFPKDELYGLTSQLRRAVLSVVLNIVEGHSRNNKKEFRSFLRISLGSLAEVGYLLDFALRRKYLSRQVSDELCKLREECGRVLWKLYQSQLD